MIVLKSWQVRRGIVTLSEIQVSSSRDLEPSYTLADGEGEAQEIWLVKELRLSFPGNPSLVLSGRYLIEPEKLISSPLLLLPRMSVRPRIESSEQGEGTFEILGDTLSREETLIKLMEIKPDALDFPAIEWGQLSCLSTERPPK